MMIPNQQNRGKMSDEAIIEGVNCPKSRWIYRGIAMLASVVWLIRFVVVLLWPSSAWEGESYVVVLYFAAPFLYSAVMVVRSFYVPVPVPFPTTAENSRDLSGMPGIAMITVFGIAYCHNIEMCIYGLSFVTGLLAVWLLSYPAKDVCVQHAVYADFVLCLVAYLGYQGPVWILFVFVAALFLVNYLLYEALQRRIDFNSLGEEEDLFCLV